MTDAAQRGHCLLRCGVEERCHQALHGSLGGPSGVKNLETQSLSMPFLVDGCWWSIHPGGRPASFHHYGVGLTPVCTTWKSPGTTSQSTRTGHPRWVASRARCQTQSQLLLWRQWIFLKSGKVCHFKRLGWWCRGNREQRGHGEVLQAQLEQLRPSCHRMTNGFPKPSRVFLFLFLNEFNII